MSVAGKRYKVSFVAWANTGYEFAEPSSITSTIDGYTATVSQYKGRKTSAVIEVSYVFTCQEKAINAVTLSAGAFVKGTELTNTFFTANGEGVMSTALTSFTKEGNSIVIGEKVTSGEYGASVLIIPEEGYKLTNATTVKYSNNSFTLTGFVGRGAIYKSADDLWVVECTHSYGDWDYDATSHWQSCTSCGEKTNIGAHEFSKSTVDGNTVYTCSTCGYVKSGKNTVDNFLYAHVEGGVDIIQYKGSAANVNVPATLAGKTVVSIGNYAFANAPSKTTITSITLPSTIKTIGRCAFNGCSALASINIPAGVKRIEQGTFQACSALANITVPYGVDFIGDDAFYGTAIASIVIPCSVKSIGSDAFRGCSNLASIVLPAGLTSVGKYNFDNKSNFKNIYFRGTFDEWSAVTIASSNTNSATVSYNYDAKYDVGQHKYIVAQTVAPTCVDEGYTLNMCEGCGDAFKTDVKPATGVHTYNSGAITTEPTCVDKGEKTYLCTVCGAAKTEEVAATGIHTYDEENATIVHPTCTKAGSITYSCTVCGTTKVKSIKATGHMYMGEVTKAPTFKATGVMTYNCVESDASYTNEIPKLAGTKATKVKAGKKKLTVALKKNLDVDGYQIQYSTNKKFKKGKKITKTVTIKKAATVKKTIKKLKSGKKYYIRVRAYKTIDGKKQYSKWSKYKKAVKVR